MTKLLQLAKNRNNRPNSEIPQCTRPISQHTTFGTEMHISVLNGVLWDMGQGHCEICEIGQ